ncbi:hypothetical protein GGH93_002311 [Coemansia aciculifera]|nr:hypothetical protein GGH93_002311 [Coemansia aciculifera]
MSKPPNKRPGGRILPARRLIPQIEPQQQFDKIALAINEIYKHNVSQLSFEEYYRTAYNLVLSKNGSLLYNGVRTVLETHMRESLERDILQRAQTADANPTTENNEAFLFSVRLLWSEHVTAMLMIKDILMYVDNVYVKTAHLPSIYDMGMCVFRDTVLLASTGSSGLGMRVAKAVLRQISGERNGEEINRSTLQGISNMLVELRDTTSPLRTVYEVILEPQLLAESRVYYHDMAALRIKTMGASEYARAAQADLDAETDRVQTYLALTTAELLRGVLQDELVTAYAPDILTISDDGLTQMLDRRDIPALGVLYNIYSPLPQPLSVLRSGVMNHILALGGQITASLQASDSGEAKNGDTLQSKPGTTPEASLGAAAKTAMALRWVQDVLALYDVYDEFFHKSFNEGSSMRSAINDAFIEVINANNRAPELLSLFMDDNLKNGLKRKAEQDVDHLLERSVLMFRFLKNKDAFEHYYKVHLARRLLFARSESDDAEHSLVSKLKVECGSQFTLKLEGMFKDMQLSMDMARELRGSSEYSNLGLDLNVSVLTPTFWPATVPAPAPAQQSSSQAAAEQPTATNGKSNGEPMSVILPNGVLSDSVDAFSAYYLKHHSGRRLTWQYAMGNADLKVQFGARTHELNVSTYQMLILLLFVDDGSSSSAKALTTAEIQQLTHIPEEPLGRQLQSLACGKYRILNKTPKSRDVSPADSFTFNMDFKSPQYRIRIPVVSARSNIETEKEKAASQAVIGQERLYLIEAAIVRIMKTRKQMSHDMLVNETVSQLSSRFLPSSKMIKDGIGKLLDREYLQRSPEDPRLYHYLA